MGRHLALLGGTTTAKEILIGLRFLLYPKSIIEGSNIAAYEQQFARTTHCKYAHSFSSGRVGLYGLLKCLGVAKDDEVLIQVPTHIVVANAIRYLGAKPVYVDCQLDDYNLNLEDARHKITSKTKVMILQHTFGHPVDMDAAVNLANTHNIIIIEDCVHALGSRYKGRLVGSFGRAAFFSTEETKIISSTMGGMVVTNDSDLSKMLTQFRLNCRKPGFMLTYGYVLKLLFYHWTMHPKIHGFFRKMYELLGKRNPLPIPVSAAELLGEMPKNYLQLFSNAQAALAASQLERLDQIIAHRQKISEIYNRIFTSRRIKISTVNKEATSAYVRYPVWVKDRQKAISAMRHKTVLGTWFSSVLEEAVHPKYGDYHDGSCPKAELAARHLVNLPTHLRVTEQDAEILAHLLAESAG